MPCNEAYVSSKTKVFSCNWRFESRCPPQSIYVLLNNALALRLTPETLHIAKMRFVSSYEKRIFSPILSRFNAFVGCLPTASCRVAIEDLYMLQSPARSRVMRRQREPGKRWK